jgi:cobalt-zinc-cadmium resistance protein CzcA
VRLPEAIRTDIDQLHELPVPLPGGMTQPASDGMRPLNVGTAAANFVPFGEIATLEIAPRPNQISREIGSGESS